MMLPVCWAARAPAYMVSSRSRSCRRTFCGRHSTAAQDMSSTVCMGTLVQDRPSVAPSRRGHLHQRGLPRRCGCIIVNTQMAASDHNVATLLVLCKTQHPAYAAVVASEKGVVVGRLTFQEDGDVIDCARMGVGGKAIPPNVDKVSPAGYRVACELLSWLDTHLWGTYTNLHRPVGCTIHLIHPAHADGSILLQLLQIPGVPIYNPNCPSRAGVQHTVGRDVHPAGGEGRGLHAAR